LAYDEELSAQFRDMLDGMVGISEKKMMGGLCFMLNGHMIGGADRNKDGIGRFMFRVGKDNEAEAIDRLGGEVMEMAGRRMSGMFFVGEDECDDKQLKDWLSLALSNAASLPPKKPKPPKAPKP